MNPREKKFKKASEQASFDLGQRKTLNHNLEKYSTAVENGLDYFSNLSLARKTASGIKDYTLNNLDQLLLTFEKNAKKNGIQVLWARTADEVISQVHQIADKHDVKLVVKTKSMVSEELHLNEKLEELKIRSLETDLGEFIVQAAGEKPFHILTPAMHKSKEDVAKQFHEQFGTPENANPEELTKYVRSYLRDKFVEADLGITGANFLLADTGSIALTENEGNGMQIISWPETLVTIAGFEKIIPSMGDLDLFWPLVSVMGTGQYMTAYNSILSGPRAEDELDGPSQVYLILFDGGRSRLFEEKDHNLALKCIRCGACLNYCPVYKNIGGHAYDTVYTGPIGSVISKYMDGTEDSGFLNFASSLCGKCTEVCPVNIPLHQLLLLNRKKMVEEKQVAPMENRAMRYYLKFMKKRSKLERIPSGLKNFGFNVAGKKVWGPRRTPLVFAKQSFAKTRMNKKN